MTDIERAQEIAYEHFAQKFLELASDRAKVLAGECKDCGGGGKRLAYLSDYPRVMGDCPTCAEIRKIAEWCWHEEIEPTSNKTECSCGELFKYKPVFYDHQEMNNLTFTIQTIRSTMEVLGLWKRFVKWNDDALQEFHVTGYHPVTYFHIIIEASADILTSDTLLLEAVISYMKEVE